MDTEGQRIPNVGELVIAKISRVAQFGAHCKLIEYGDIDAFLPIREVSSGWIKNIHEFIHEGQTVVCKVQFYDREKGTIDVSIKKVNSKEAKDKLGAYNLEKRLAALFERALKEAHITTRAQKEQYSNYIKTDFGSFTRFMKLVSDEAKEFSEAKLPPKVKESLVSVLKANKKERIHKVAYILTMFTFNTGTGISELKRVLSDVEASGCIVEYISAPRYRIIAEGKDYAAAESKVEAAMRIIQEELKDGETKMEKEKLKREKADIINTI